MGRRRRVAILFGMSLLSLVIVSVGLVFFIYIRFHSSGPLAADTTFIVPKGSGLNSIARRLTAAGILDESWTLRLVAVISGDAGLLRAGEYHFSAGVSAYDVLQRLRSNQVVQRSITFPEGISVIQALNILDATQGLRGIVFPRPQEGDILPETYQYQWGESRNTLIERMRQAMSQTLGDLWPQRQVDLPLKDPQQAVVLASIVEKETAQPDERDRVAAVFINRLRAGMRLQSDPTVIYALTEGLPLGRPLTRSDLATPSPYNTYRVAGLPPGPICLPGKASLMAVLHPAQTDDLYFVADGSGGHAFAKTLAEHNRNVAQWRKINKRETQKNVP